MYLWCLGILVTCFRTWVHERSWWCSVCWAVKTERAGRGTWPAKRQLMELVGVLLNSGFPVHGLPSAVVNCAHYCPVLMTELGLWQMPRSFEDTWRVALFISWHKVTSRMLEAHSCFLFIFQGLHIEKWFFPFQQVEIHKLPNFGEKPGLWISVRCTRRKSVWDFLRKSCVQVWSLRFDR